jgi:hypothetical protein
VETQFFVLICTELVPTAHNAERPLLIILAGVLLLLAHRWRAELARTN